MNRIKFNPTETFVKATIVLLLISIASAIPFDWSDNIKKALIGFWIVIPPLWLWFEFCYLYDLGRNYR